MKIIVVGAGMGGLSAAIALAQTGHDVHVYERVVENRPVGAAISVWSNGVKCMNYLGLADEMAALGGRMDHMAYREHVSGADLCRFSLAPVTEQTGQRPYPVARAELQAMLMAQVPADRLHLGRECVGVDDDGEGVTVRFADGTTDRGDLVVAADGARSRLREHVLGGPVERRYAGYVNFNGLVAIDPEIGPADQWTTYVGQGKRVSVMPVAGERFYYFFDVPLPVGLPYERSRAREVLAEHFDGWAPGVQRLIGAIDPLTTNRVEIHDLEPFHTWTRGRVALLGDAAHSTTPDIGQGGCSAMEDAIVLAITLRTCTLGVEDALRRYAARRSARAADLVLRARKRSDVTHAVDPGATAAWYEELRHETGAGVIRGIVSNIEGNPLG